MKIAMIANSSSGLYNFRRDLILRFLHDGHTVTVITAVDERADQLAALGVRLIETPISRRSMNPLAELALLRTYLRLLRQERPDAAVTYTIKPNVYAGLACRLLRIPSAANVTGLGTAFEGKGWLRRAAVLLNRTGLKRAGCVFFENAENRALFLRERIVKEEQAVLLSGAGVQLRHFCLTPYPGGEEGTRFLFIGRVMREKGFDELLRAGRRLYEEGFACSLDVVGGCEESYLPLIRAAEKEGWLRFHDYQMDVRPFIERAHCFVLPSWHEGMANTNLESAAMGRPLITSDIPGCREAVEEGVTGFCVPAKDPEALYRAMVRFIGLPWEEKAAMGAAGRRRMERLFDKDRVVEETAVRVYALARPGGQRNEKAGGNS